MPTDPRYPIGPFSLDDAVKPEDRPRLLDDVAMLPERLRAALGNAGENELGRTYRAGGWTVRQVIHHVADSHMNGYTRFKLALTESNPTIKPYDEARWAELADVDTTPVEVSLALLDALHRRWSALLRGLADGDFRRTYVHPQHGRALTLDVGLANYAWHGRHHTAHVRAALGRGDSPE